MENKVTTALIFIFVFLVLVTSALTVKNYVLGGEIGAQRKAQQAQIAALETQLAQIAKEKESKNIGNEQEKADLIRVTNFSSNQEIESPLTIEGQARGSWFFEADFPVKLYDEEDNLVAQAVATTDQEWMSEEFIPFKASLEFEKPASKKGTLVLEKNNPSGLPEHDDELRIPIVFK